MSTTSEARIDVAAPVERVSRALSEASERHR